MKVFFKKLFSGLKPADVFTPATIAKINYILRPSLTNSLYQHFNTAGKQIIVFGYSGSGKTTLITNELKRCRKKYIISRCTKNSTYKELLYDAFDKLDGYYRKSHKSTVSTRLGAKYKMLDTGIQANYDETYERCITPQLNADNLAKQLGENKLYWVIEDLHQLKPNEKIEIAGALKIFIDTANDYENVKIICLGAVNSSRELIAIDPNLNTRVADFYVPLLSNEEIKVLIENGFRLLKINLPQHIKKQIIELSNNIGSVAHQLCLNICTNCGVKKVNYWSKNITVNDNIFTKSIQTYVEEHSVRFKSLMDKIKASKTGQLVLSHFRDADIEGVSLDSILEKNKGLDMNTLEDYMKKLCSVDYDEVCRYDVDSNKYMLGNPFFQVYIRMNYKINDGQSPKKKTRKKQNTTIQTPMTEAQFAQYYQLLENIIKMQNALKQMNK